MQLSGHGGVLSGEPSFRSRPSTRLERIVGQEADDTAELRSAWQPGGPPYWEAFACAATVTARGNGNDFTASITRS
jgi:hypothetical protein